jgi:hypothetical protein
VRNGYPFPILRRVGTVVQNDTVLGSVRSRTQTCTNLRTYLANVAGWGNLTGGRYMLHIDSFIAPKYRLEEVSMKLRANTLT